MIVGSLNQPDLCRFLPPALRRALDSIAAMPAEAPDGIVELEGPAFYLNVHGYVTRRREDCQWESHRHTADVQVCLSGGECIDWCATRPAPVGTHYEAAADRDSWPQTLTATETVALVPGRFVVFLPGELHRPAIANGCDVSVRKVVAKIDARFLGPA